MMRDRAEAVIPTAAALATAVARRDAAAVDVILRGCGDLQALAVVLADNVGRINDQRLIPRRLTRQSRYQCIGCGTETRSVAALCPTCRDVHSSPEELPPDGWVTVRGVARFVA